MSNKKKQREEWQSELDAALNEENRPMPSWSPVGYEDWRAETQGFFDSLPTAYNPANYKSTTTKDISRWKKGADYTYAYSFAGGGSEKELAIIIADSVVRTANAPCNHSVKDENGKEQFLQLQVGGNCSDSTGLANTSLSPVVFLSGKWITQACVTGGLGASADPKAKPEEINEKINKLTDAYTGLALVLATAKKTMDPDVAKKAKQNVAFAAQLNGGITRNDAQMVENSLTHESALSLWRTVEYETAQKDVLKDWPGFSNYTDAAQEMNPAAKIEAAINEAMSDAEAMKKYIADCKKEALTMADPMSAEAKLGLASRVELNLLTTKVRAATEAINYVTAKRREKIKLPKEVLDCVKHVIKQPVPDGTILEQSEAIGRNIVDYFKKKKEESEQGKDEDKEEEPKDNDPQGEGEGEGEGEGSPSNVEQGEDPKPNKDWHPAKGSPEPGKHGVPGGLGSTPEVGSFGRDSEGVNTPMQPTDVCVNPDDLCDKISKAGGITMGFMIGGFRPSTMAQRELMRQMAEPIARIVKSKIQFRASSPAFNVVGLRRGEIDDGNLYLANHDPRVFCRNEEVTRPTVAVGMLLDQSGSMSEQGSSNFKPDRNKINALLQSEFPGKFPGSYYGNSIIQGSKGSFAMKFGSPVGPFGFDSSSSSYGSSFCRSDQVAAVGAGIYMGLSSLPGVELYLSGFYTGDQLGVSPMARRRGVVHDRTPLRQFQQEKADGQYPMQLFEYASRKVGKLKLDQLFSRLCNVSSDHSNADGFAIMHAAARMNELYPEVRMKVLFVLSDGQPSSSYHDMTKTGGHWEPTSEYIHYGGTLSMRHIRDICRWSAMHQGVIVRGIGIDNAYSVIEGRIMFGENNFTVLHDIESSASIIAAFLARTFHKLGT